jgi:hypothetical protein
MKNEEYPVEEHGPPDPEKVIVRGEDYPESAREDIESICHELIMGTLHAKGPESFIEKMSEQFLKLIIEGQMEFPPP